MRFLLLKKNNFFIIINLLLTIFLFTSCDSGDPVEPQENHFEAIGTVVYDATGAVAASILRGVTNDTLYAPEGDLSDHFTVKFYDENEEIIDPPVDEEDHYLGFEVGDAAVVATYQHPGEEGGYEFHLRGLKKGATTLELFIYHVDHKDYRSGNIPVVVK
ncbi:MAG: hypothetical protein V1720_12855 [bacterium]